VSAEEAWPCQPYRRFGQKQPATPSVPHLQQRRPSPSLRLPAALPVRASLGTHCLPTVQATHCTCFAPPTVPAPCCCSNVAPKKDCSSKERLLLHRIVSSKNHCFKQWLLQRTVAPKNSRMLLQGGHMLLHAPSMHYMTMVAMNSGD
jgi:hypothetical protein